MPDSAAETACPADHPSMRGTATAWRYVQEAIALLSAASDGLDTAMRRIRLLAYAILDGTLIPIDRVADQKQYYSGKHKRHDMNVQVIADAAGRPVWASAALPGAAHDLTAARSHGIIDALTRADVTTFADKGYQGARGSVRTPFKRRRFRPKLSRRQKAVNRAHAKIRARGERAIATLKAWRILVKLRCCPRRAIGIVHCHLGWLAAARGDVDTIHEYSQTIERWAAPRGSRAHLAKSARNLALAALTVGDREAAYEHATTLTPAGALPTFAHAALWGLLDLVEAAVRVGRTTEARAHLSAAEAAGLAELTPRLRLHVHAARALLSDDPIGLYRQALALPGVEQWPFEHARIRLALGEHYRRHQQPGAARPELRRATDLFARLGATMWNRRAEQELRATGIATTGTPSRADSQHVDLTAQQLEVAQLAAAGLSNKDIGQRLIRTTWHQQTDVRHPPNRRLAMPSRRFRAAAMPEHGGGNRLPPMRPGQPQSRKFQYGWRATRCRPQPSTTPR